MYLFLNIIFNNCLYNQKIDYYKSNNIVNDIYKVETVTYKDNYQLINIKKNNYYFHIYLYDDNINEQIIPGCFITVCGNIETINNISLKHSFNYYEYCKSNKIIGKIKPEKISVIKNTFSFNLINYRICKYYDKTYSILASSYLKALVLGNKSSMDITLKDNISNIGISHLFVVSGLHVAIFVIIISFICKLFKIKNTYQNIITIIILLFYLLLTNVLISVFRVFLSQILKFLNKDKQINTFNLFSINLIISMIIFPNQINTYSFILTYLISSMIILSKEILKNKSNLKQSIIISIISVLVTLPVIISINGEINMLSIIYNILFIPLMTYLILPLSLITSILPFIKEFYEQIIYLFNNLINTFSNLNTGIIIFPKFNLIFIIIYYLFLYLILFNFEIKNKIKTIKYFITFIIILFIYQNKQIFNLNTEISFLNLQIGESTLIKYPSNTCNILIDTGEKEEILLYLKKEGIRRIDYLIISHGDSDHNYMMKDIIMDLNVKNVIISMYDNISLSYLNHLNKTVNLIKIKAPNNIKTKLFEITFYNPIKNHDDINDNSLVFTLNIKHLNIFFTGDITKEIEEEIVSRYKIKIDILKVAHHGSNTSSSNYFLSQIEFKVAVAMNGYNNKYGFPNQKTINRFKNKTLLNTIDHNTITFKKYPFIKHFKYKNIKI